MDLAALTSRGTPISDAWPKLTTHRAVATPLLGSFGTRDTDPGAARVVVGLLPDRFRAPGDDLLCGTADRYELVTSNKRIDGGGFGDAEPLGGAPDPADAGTEQAYEVPPKARRYVAIRAVDAEGNVGRPAVVDRRGRPPGRGKGSFGAG